MNPYLQVEIQNKIYGIIENCQTMDDTGRAAKVIDAYEADSSMNKIDRIFISDARNMLCDKTFELYAIEYPVNA